MPRPLVRETLLPPAEVGGFHCIRCGSDELRRLFPPPDPNASSDAALAKSLTTGASDRRFDEDARRRRRILGCRRSSIVGLRSLTLALRALRDGDAVWFLAEVLIGCSATASCSAVCPVPVGGSILAFSSWRKNSRQSYLAYCRRKLGTKCCKYLTQWPDPVVNKVK